MTQTLVTPEVRETAAKELIELPEIDVDTLDPRELSFYEDEQNRLFAVAEGEGSSGAVELTPAEETVVGEPAVINTDSDEFSEVRATEPQETPDVNLDVDTSTQQRRNFD